MTPSRHLWLLALAACAATAWSGSTNKEPHIGYLYPGGGQQGTAAEIAVGGQFLRGTTNVYVSGEGVRATVIKYYRPVRNLQKEQRDELQRRLKELKEKRLAEMPGKGKGLAIRFPGERYNPKGKAKGKPKTAEKQDAAKAQAAETPAAKLPEHPLLRDMEKKSLRELFEVANGFFDSKANKRKQLNPQIAEVVLIEVKIDPDAPAGDRSLRVQTPVGLSNPMCFQVGTLPEAREREPNDPNSFDPFPKEPPLALPVLLNGQIMPGDVDRFRLRAKKGQQLVIEANARRLVPFLADAVPGWFQATVALYDARGREVAFADDYRFSPDPVLFYKVPADGDYELEVRDSIYRGREDFVYRVAVGEFPFITQVFPLGGRKGTKTFAAIGGWNLPAKRLRLDTQNADEGVRQAALRPGQRPSNVVTYAVGSLSERTEAEPNNSPKKATLLDLPVIINGRIGKPGDVDVFEFEGIAGDEIVADVQARRLHSPLDSLVWLTDASGSVLKRNDDHVQKDGHLHPDMGFLTHHADSYLTARLPKDGTYYVHLADAQGHGSDAHGYRLRVGPPQPDFTLLVTPSSLSLLAECSAPFTVHVLRREGFEGAVNVALKGAPAGFALTGGRIPKGRSRIRMTLTAPAKPPAQPIAVRLEGRALIGGKTVSRPAAPCDDVMQAFLFRHLAPSRELMAAVAKPRWASFPAKLAGHGPVRVPAGGTAQVRLKSSRRARGQVHLALSEPPEGVTLDGVRVVDDGLTFRLKATGDAAKAGLAGNLIVEAYVEYSPRSKGKGGGKKATGKQRLPLGALPAIPFEIVQP